MMTSEKLKGALLREKERLEEMNNADPHLLALCLEREPSASLSAWLVRAAAVNGGLAACDMVGP